MTEMGDAVPSALALDIIFACDFRNGFPAQEIIYEPLFLRWGQLAAVQ